MIYVLLPAYNEEDSLDGLLPKIKAVMKKNKYKYKVIVVDDGSQDKTYEKLTKYASLMPLEVIIHTYNRGLGETIRDAFERAADISQPDDIIIRMDCDDTHEPKYIPEMVKKIKQGNDVVIASRFLPGGGAEGLNSYRTFISRCANLVMKTAFPIKDLKEYSCGFRAYKASIIKDALKIFGNNFIDLKGLGFTCTLEKLIKLKMLKAKIVEIPFILRYDQKRSPSKMLSSITTMGYLILIMKYIYPWWGKDGKTLKKKIKEYRQNKK